MHRDMILEVLVFDRLLLLQTACYIIIRYNYFKGIIYQIEFIYVHSLDNKMQQNFNAIQHLSG